MAGEDIIGFDLAEWYLKRDGVPWGPLDVSGIRALAAQGRVNASTLVSRDDDGAWMRLKDAIPGWECERQPVAQPEPPDPPLHVFSARIWVDLIESYIVLGLLFLLFATFNPRSDWVELVFGFVGAGVANVLVAIFGGIRERVEVTQKVVRLMAAGRCVSALPVGDIDTDARPAGALGHITGRRTIRSRSGQKLTINRRAYGDEDYAELMRLLQLSPD
jgi:hypothetical protein